MQNPTITIIGLGYVGLPLAVEFGKQFTMKGFDINRPRIDELRGRHDSTLEVDAAELLATPKLGFTCDPAEIATANVYGVTVPTPIDEHKRPDHVLYDLKNVLPTAAGDRRL